MIRIFRKEEKKIWFWYPAYFIVLALLSFYNLLEVKKQSQVEVLEKKSVDRFKLNWKF